MELSFVYKSRKLLKIRLNYDEGQNRIQSIFITGDFFLHPEAALEKIEENLRGITVTEDKILRSVSQSLEGSQPFGFDAKSLTEAIILCVRQFSAGWPKASDDLLPKEKEKEKDKSQGSKEGGKLAE